MGEVAGGKGHLLIETTREDERAGRSRAYTACHRLTWVRPVPWSDLLWTDASWACRVCQQHVSDRLDSEQRDIELEAAKARAARPERPPLTDAERAERQDRFRDMRLMETLHFIALAAARQAAKPKVLEPREALLAQIDVLNLSQRRSRKAIRTYGETIDRQAIEVKELRVQVDRLAATNKALAREAARAEVLKEFVVTLYRQP
jgi:hypothetical protein